MKDGDALLESIKEILINHDEYKEERKAIRSLFDIHCDGMSTKRIAEHFVK